MPLAAAQFERTGDVPGEAVAEGGISVIVWYALVGVALAAVAMSVDMGSSFPSSARLPIC